MVFWMGPKAPTVLGRYCQDVVTRWQSEAYQRYIRTARESLAAVWRHLANWLFLCASAQRGLQHSVVVNRNCLRSLVRLEQQLAVESVGGFWWKNSNFTVSLTHPFQHPWLVVFVYHLKILHSLTLQNPHTRQTTKTGFRSIPPTMPRQSSSVTATLVMRGLNYSGLSKPPSLK